MVKIKILNPPFDSEFDQVILDLYTGIGAKIKSSQPYAKDYAVAAIVCQDPENDRVLGRVVVYKNDALTLAEKPCITWGGYECVADETVSVTLLNAVMEYTKTRYPDHAIVGPMEGSTWQNYRFPIDNSGAGQFLSEPFAMPYYASQWEKFGAKPLMEYGSNLATFDSDDRQNLDVARQYFTEKGITLRNIQLHDAENELRKLARFNLNSFQDAFLFSPISTESFIEKYRAVLPIIKPELVWFACVKDEICGMIFAFPDALDPSGKRVVVKTLARLPGEVYKGLGDLLCAQLVNSMIDGGYTRMVHALMRVDNASNRNSGKFWGTPFRNYRLYQLD